MQCPQPGSTLAYCILCNGAAVLRSDIGDSVWARGVLGDRRRRSEVIRRYAALTRVRECWERKPAGNMAGLQDTGARLPILIASEGGLTC